MNIPMVVISMSKADRLEEVLRILDQISEDTTVPRNIRKGAVSARESLTKEEEDLDLRSAKAISILDDLANDPNVPLHGRTLIWNVIGKLENLK